MSTFPEYRMMVCPVAGLRAVRGALGSGQGAAAAIETLQSRVSAERNAPIGSDHAPAQVRMVSAALESHC